MDYLKLIEDHKDILITGSQVEMEYQKNRQIVILDSLTKFKTPDWSNLSVPALLAESSEAKDMEDLKKEIGSLQSEVNGNIEKVLRSPSTDDRVYQTLKQIFRSQSKYNLRTKNSKYEYIKKLAVERFMLGYPPRKKNDISIGDAINWEWVISCASQSKKNIIIVTRDSDYGALWKKEAFLNDFLAEEFRDRVSDNQKIVLTTRLSEAFKSIDLPVSADMVEEETRVIEAHQADQMSDESSGVTEKIFDILKQYR